MFVGAASRITHGASPDRMAAGGEEDPKESLDQINATLDSLEADLVDLLKHEVRPCLPRRCASWSMHAHERSRPLAPPPCVRA